MDPAYAFLRPLLFSLPAERAHRLTLQGASLVGRHGLLAVAARRYAPKPQPELQVEAFGCRFAHPLGLAAGLDKDGEAIAAWEAFGFAFMELGTVTPDPGQPGNEAPRIERLVSDRAIVNRLGFPNRGAQHLTERVVASSPSIPVGINIGKAKKTQNKEAAADYRSTFETVADCADYIAVNVSSPNTPGLRDLQNVEALRTVLEAVCASNQRRVEGGGARRPVLVKIAPDLADPDIDAVADLAVELSLDGIVATNTTLRRDGLQQRPTMEGGLSGAPLTTRADLVLKQLYRRLEGRITLVGVGGIMGPEQAWARIRSGANLLQTYTGFVYRGPAMITETVRGLAERLQAGNFRSIHDVVGSDAG